MVLNITQERIIKVATILGVVQGFAWMIMSLIVILLHFQDSPTIKAATTIEEATNFFIRFLFISDTFTDSYGNELPLPRPDMIVVPTTFCTFMFFYLFLNAYWAIVSSVLFRAIFKKDFKHIKSPGDGFVAAVVLISLLDFILVCCLGSDYANCGLDFCTPIGIVMTIAAKGFVLWTLNVIFAILVRGYLVEISKSLQNPSPASNLGI